MVIVVILPALHTVTCCAPPAAFRAVVPTPVSIFTLDLRQVKMECMCQQAALGPHNALLRRGLVHGQSTSAGLVSKRYDATRQCYHESVQSTYSVRAFLARLVGVACIPRRTSGTLTCNS
jgi:hypothetical protein